MSTVIEKSDTASIVNGTSTPRLSNRFTAAYEKTDDGWWVGQVLEVPGALTQGKTLDEARGNLEEALTLILECARDGARRDLSGHEIIEEPIVIPVLHSL